MMQDSGNCVVQPLPKKFKVSLGSHFNKPKSEEEMHEISKGGMNRF